VVIRGDYLEKRWRGRRDGGMEGWRDGGDCVLVLGYRVCASLLGCLVDVGVGIHLYVICTQYMNQHTNPPLSHIPVPLPLDSPECIQSRMDS
jgi:hypothetical protein